MINGEEMIIIMRIKIIRKIMIGTMTGELMIITKKIQILITMKKQEQ